MSSPKDTSLDSARDKSCGEPFNEEKVLEKVEMNRGYGDNIQIDESISASGDHSGMMGLDNVAGVKAKETENVSKQEEDAIRYGKEPRNPITGLGLNGDGVGGLKAKRPKAREGNPVTGEGYKPGGNDYVDRTNADKNNRGSPGRYSSGLW